MKHLPKQHNKLSLAFFLPFFLIPFLFALFFSPWIANSYQYINLILVILLIIFVVTFRDKWQFQQKNIINFTLHTTFVVAFFNLFKMMIISGVTAFYQIQSTTNFYLELWRHTTTVSETLFYPWTFYWLLTWCYRTSMRHETANNPLAYFFKQLPKVKDDMLTATLRIVNFHGMTYSIIILLACTITTIYVFITHIFHFQAYLQISITTLIIMSLWLGIPHTRLLTLGIDHARKQHIQILSFIVMIAGIILLSWLLFSDLIKFILTWLTNKELVFPVHHLIFYPTIFTMFYWSTLLIAAPIFAYWLARKSLQIPFHLALLINIILVLVINQGFNWLITAANSKILFGLQVLTFILLFLFYFLSDKNFFDRLLIAFNYGQPEKKLRSQILTHNIYFAIANMVIAVNMLFYLLGINVIALIEFTMTFIIIIGFLIIAVNLLMKRKRL